MSNLELPTQTSGNKQTKFDSASPLERHSLAVFREMSTPLEITADEVDAIMQLIIATDIPEEFYERMLSQPPEHQQDVGVTLGSWLPGIVRGYRLHTRHAETSGNEGWSPAGDMTRLGLPWHYLIHKPIEELGINTPPYNTGGLESWGMTREKVEELRRNVTDMGSVKKAQAVMRGEVTAPSFTEGYEWVNFMGSLCMLKVEDAMKRSTKEKTPVGNI